MKNQPTPDSSIEECSSHIMACLGIDSDDSVKDLKQSNHPFLHSQYLLSGISHHFNNPATIITLSAELLLESEHLDLETRDAIITILRQGQRIGRIVQKLHESTRYINQHRQFVKLYEVITRALQEMRSRIPANVHVQVKEEPYIEVIFADPDALCQVIKNLLDNAINAMPHGGDIILLVADAASQHWPVPHSPAHRNRRGILLSITDTGCGIQAEHLPEIFKPFFSTFMYEQHLGLGLTQAVHIVHQHHGEIVVESEVGKGSTFHIWIPVLPH